MHTPFNLWNKLLAWMGDEVDASTLEAYHGAGRILADEQLAAELHRHNLSAAGLTSWTVPVHMQIYFASLWNAFVLQTIGDQLLEADYRLSPSTKGHLPAYTSARAHGYYRQVEKWMNLAHQAKENPQFVMPVSLLPANLQGTTNPKASAKAGHIKRYLEGLLSAACLLRAHSNTLLENLAREPSAESDDAIMNQLRQRQAHANMTLEYGMQLWSNQNTQGIYQKVEKNLELAVQHYFILGQFIAMPRLLLKHNTPPIPEAITSIIPPVAVQIAQPELPADMDIWCLTDSSVQHTTDRQRRSLMLAAMWQADPAPDKARTIQSRLNQALEQGEIDFASRNDGKRVGHFHQCPWAPIYISKRPLMIGGDPLRANQKFTYVCDADKTEGETPVSFGNRILRL